METLKCSAMDARLLESCAAVDENLPVILAEDACQFCVRCAPLFKELAFKDHTGALNRRGIQREFTALQEAGAAFGAIYVDVDNMKTVNDNLGHDTGDEVIRQTISQLAQGKREGDALIRTGRLGGDEFVLLLTEDEDVSRQDQERRTTALSTEEKMSAAAKRHQTAFVAREDIKRINTALPDDKQVGLKVAYAPYPYGSDQPNLEEWLQTFDVKGPAAHK